jgi:hypothetical protein
MFYKVFFPQKYLQDLCEHTCSRSKISMVQNRTQPRILHSRSKDESDKQSDQDEFVKKSPKIAAQPIFCPKPIFHRF